MANNITRRAFITSAALAAAGLTACAQDNTNQNNTTSTADSTSGSKEAEKTEAGTASTTPRPSTCGRLHADGTKLVDEKGNPVQLKGFSTHGLAWYGQFVDEAGFAQLSGWGANLARLPLYTHESGGWCTDGDHDKLRTLLDNGIKYATVADMYVIIDWHVLQETSPLVYLDQAKEFWDDISRSYASANNVIYEICNEPNGDATWDDVRAYAREVIPVIRANDPAAPIVVGTPTWSQDILDAAAAPLDFENVFYTLHFYAGTHKDYLRQRLRAAVDGGLPVFVSEYGICDASGDGGVDQDSANQWIALLDELGVSCACWNLSNKDESASMLVASCQKTSAFEDSDLSECGRWFKSMLAGEKTAATSGSASESSEKLAPGIDSVASSDGTTCKVSLRQNWEADGKTVNLYDVTVTNTGASALSAWLVDLTFDEKITVNDSWGATLTAGDTTLHLGPSDSNAAIQPGATVQDIGFIVAMG